jgi:hypothetical protein
MKRFSIIPLLPILLFAGIAQADRGAIPFDPDVRVFVPTQTALIAWDGDEEVMILTTDLRASDSTKVLEVMPFPSEPVVSEGDMEVFSKAVSLINRKLQIQYNRNLKELVARGGKAPQAGRIVFHQMIGCHDIAVAEVKNRADFVNWVDDYLSSAHVENPKIPDGMESTVGDYIKDGYKWFVFDIVDLSETPVTNEAIQYRFKTDELFYPLRICRTNAGLANVELFVLSKDLLKDFKGVDYDKVVLLLDPVTIGTREVRSMSEEIDNMFHQNNELLFRIWQVRNRMSAFSKDLIAK